jgi:hypothetical protein
MKNYRIEIKWGVIFTLAILAWMFVEKWMGWHGESIDQHSTMTNLFAIPAIAIYLFALLDKRKSSYGGVMSWKQGFITGIGITAVVLVLSPAAQYIIHTFISPGYFSNIIEHSVETGNLTREAAETQFALGNYMIMSAVGVLIMGLVTSAVVALFTKKSPK